MVPPPSDIASPWDRALWAASSSSSRISPGSGGQTPLLLPSAPALGDALYVQAVRPVSAWFSFFASLSPFYAHSLADRSMGASENCASYVPAARLMPRFALAIERLAALAEPIAPAARLSAPPARLLRPAARLFVCPCRLTPLRAPLCVSAHPSTKVDHIGAILSIPHFCRSRN